MKLISVIFVIVLAFQVFPFRSFAQINPHQEEEKLFTEHLNIFKPAPDAASLGQYSYYPVSHSSGVPQISIPIYVIQTRNLSIPITLRYHASGIKVSQEASNVGLGWSLNVGASLSRTVYGMEDFLIRGYNTNLDKIELLKEMDYAIMYEAADGLLDTEPDVYSYILNDLSGSFLRIDDTTWYKPFDKDIKADRINSTTWKMISPEGIDYDFGGLSDYYEMSTSNVSTGSEGFVFNYISTWLSRYISKNNDTIEFTYVDSEERIRTLTHSQIRIIAEGTNEECDQDLDVTRTYGTEIITSVKRLNSIVFDNGKLEFYYNHARQDVNGENNDALTEIYLRNDKDQILRRWRFEYDYFGDVDYVTTCRLMLSNVLEFDSEGEMIRQYTLEYNEPANIPSKNSYDQDHWGYYNATDNLTLIPEDPPGGIFDNGANRETNEEAMKTGTLESVTYPTGGRAEFEYEANDIPVEYQPIEEKNISVSRHETEGKSIEQFYLDHKQFVNVTYSAVNCLPGITFVSLINLSDNSRPVNCHSCSNSDQPIELDAGTYQIQVEIDECSYECTGCSGMISVRYYSLDGPVITTNKKVGGLRLKSTTMLDPKHPDLVQNKRFIYRIQSNPDSSSGVLTHPRKYEDFNNLYKYSTITPIPPSYPSYDCQYIPCQVFHKQSFIPGLISGSPVTYSEVKEEDIGETSNGHKWFKFTDMTDLGGTAIVQPSDRSWYRGLMLSEDIFDHTNNLLSSSLFNYSIQKYNKEIPAYKVLFLMKYYTPSNDSCDLFNMQDYHHEISWYRQDDRIDIEHYDEGNISRRTKYFYDHLLNHHNLASVERTGDNYGDTKEYFKYPMDYVVHDVSTSDSMYRALFKMQKKNMANTIVERYRSRLLGSSDPPEVVLEGELMEYNYDSKNDIVNPDIYNNTSIEEPSASFQPSRINDRSHTFEKDISYYQELYFDQINNFGKPLQYHNKSMSPTSVIWGYNNHIPIAKAFNAEHREIGFEGFEESTDINVTDAFKHSGEKSYLLGNNSILQAFSFHVNELVSDDYIFVLWIRSDHDNIKLRVYSDDNPGDFIQVDIPSTSLQWGVAELSFKLSDLNPGVNGVINAEIINGNDKDAVYIDDLRFHPDDAQFESNTAKPLIGITSTEDVDNNTTHYFYDASGRLSKSEDDDEYLLRDFEYHFRETYVDSWLKSSTPGAELEYKTRIAIGIDNVTISWDVEKNGSTEYLRIEAIKSDGCAALIGKVNASDGNFSWSPNIEVFCISMDGDQLYKFRISDWRDYQKYDIGMFYIALSAE